MKPYQETQTKELQQEKQTKSNDKRQTTKEYEEREAFKCSLLTHLRWLQCTRRSSIIFKFDNKILIETVMKMKFPSAGSWENTKITISKWMMRFSRLQARITSRKPKSMRRWRFDRDKIRFGGWKSKDKIWFLWGKARAWQLMQTILVINFFCCLFFFLFSSSIGSKALFMDDIEAIFQCRPSQTWNYVIELDTSNRKRRWR